jgi:transposase
MNLQDIFGIATLIYFLYIEINKPTETRCVKMNCPKCKKGNNSKSGVIKGRQRYVCKSCNVLGRQIRKQSGKRWSFIWRGLAIRRVLKFSTVAILKWIRSFGAPVPDFRAKHPVKIVELEKIYVHWFKKNIAGYGVLLIEMQKDSSTGCKGELSQSKNSKASSKILKQEA